MEELTRHTAALLLLYDEFLSSLTAEDRLNGVHNMLGAFIIFLQKKEGVQTVKGLPTIE